MPEAPTSTPPVEDPVLELASLAPEYSDEHHAVYLSVVKHAIDKQPDVKNIALAGTYGTGKSSVLRKLRDEHRGRVIELSLLTLGAKPEPVEATEDMNPAAGTTTNRIQKEIVKQLLYQQRPTDAPESRFRRISRIRWKFELLLAGIAVALAAAIALLMGVGVTTTPTLGIVFDTRAPWALTTAGYVVSAALIAGIVLGVRSLIRGRAAIEKVNAGPATITLPPRSSSYFDEYLDEIIYFFEMNEAIDIVIIEDLDRFNDPHIFEALRSLNGLLNAARQLDGRNIRFIYAIRDSVFGKLGQDDAKGRTDEARAELARANRTKFFELIVPVVPFITHKNARDLLHKLLTERGHSISKELVNVVGRHLADMRLVQNIVNEYEIFKDRLLEVPHPVPGLDPDYLFAMVVYKNAHMADFEAIRLGSSRLDRLWDRWRGLVEENIDRLERENARLQRRITNRAAASRYAVKLGSRLRQAVNALHAAPGTGLNAPTVMHEGSTVDDTALQTPEFWQRFIQSKKPISLDAFRNGPTWGSGPMNLSVAAVEALIGMRVDADRFIEESSNVDHAQIKKNDEALTFLRHHSWQQLAERSNFSSGIIDGEEARFRDWTEKLLPSKLAADLVVNGYITQYFSLYVSSFYGQLIRPDAMIYVMKHVDEGSADPEYPLVADDVEAIIRDQGRSVLQERSMLNVSILNHLLRKRRDDAATVIRNLPLFDEKGAFLARYFVVGREKQRLVEILAPQNAEIFDWLVTRASLTAAERLKLVDTAARHRSADLGYQYPDELRVFVETHYRELPTLKGNRSAPDTRSVVDLIASSGAILHSLRGLRNDVLVALRRTRAYALSGRNLAVLTGQKDLSLDALKQSHPAIFDYAIDEIGAYLHLVWVSTSTKFTVKDPALFDSILRGADWETALFSSLIQKSAPACVVASLAEYPVASWDALVEYQRAPMTFENAEAYLDERGQVTASLVSSLEAASAITGLDTATQAQRVQMALSIINTAAGTLTTKARIRLARSLEPGLLHADSIQPIAGDLVGELIRNELIADDANAFSSRLMVDWPTQAHAIKCSRNFESFIGPATLDTNFVKEVFKDPDFEGLWQGLTSATLGGYNARMPLALAALTDRVVAEQVTMDPADIEVARSRGLADEKVIELLTHFEDQISFDQLLGMLQRLGGAWGEVAQRGTRPHVVPDTPGAEAVLTRLEGGDIVSSKSREGRVFKVNLRRPPRVPLA